MNALKNGVNGQVQSNCTDHSLCLPGGDSDGALENNAGASNQANVGPDGDGDYLAIE